MNTNNSNSLFVIGEYNTNRGDRRSPRFVLYLQNLPESREHIEDYEWVKVWNV